MAGRQAIIHNFDCFGITESILKESFWNIILNPAGWLKNNTRRGRHVTKTLWTSLKVRNLPRFLIFATHFNLKQLKKKGDCDVFVTNSSRGVKCVYSLDLILLFNFRMRIIKFGLWRFSRTNQEGLQKQSIQHSNALEADRKSRFINYQLQFAISSTVIMF